jgi:class 3 adenylate cyclase
MGLSGGAEKPACLAYPLSVLYCAVRGAEEGADASKLESDFDEWNELVGRWEPAIYHRDGFVSHYVGHGLFALFPGAADDAIGAALEILEIVRVFNRERAASNPPRSPLEVGIGVATGTLLVGTMGSDQHLTSGVIGEAVDVAPRVEVLARRAGAPILIAQSTRDALTDPTVFALREVDPVALGVSDFEGRLYEVSEARASTSVSGEAG